MNIQQIQQKTAPIFSEYDIHYAGIFGSYAQGTATKKSDIDMVVKVGKLDHGIWGFVELKEKLEKALGKKVDVLSYPYLHPKFAKYMERDIIKIYERP